MTHDPNRLARGQGRLRPRLQALLALACIGMTLPASSVRAQQVQQARPAATVTVFGLVDLAVEHVDNVGPARAGLNRMPGLTGSLPSRLGFRGSEDLGDGLRAVFTLEMGFTADTGGLSQGGRMFGRQAFVGLAGSWGTLTLGRQYTMLFWSILDADQLGPGLYGSGSLDATIPNARADNAIAYRSNFSGALSGLTLGATFSLGRDTVNAGNPAGTNCPGEAAGDAKACREWSAMLKYDSAAWGAALAVDTLRGGPGAFAGLVASTMTDRHVSANGYVMLRDLKLSAGLIRRDNDGNAVSPRSDLWYLGAAYPVMPLLVLEAELFSLRFKTGGDKAALAAGRLSYSLSKRTAVYTTFGRIANDGRLALSVSSGAGGSSPVAGGSQNAIAAGVRHAF